MESRDLFIELRKFQQEQFEKLQAYIKSNSDVTELISFEDNYSIQFYFLGVKFLLQARIDVSKKVCFYDLFKMERNISISNHYKLIEIKSMTAQSYSNSLNFLQEQVVGDSRTTDKIKRLPELGEYFFAAIEFKIKTGNLIED